MMLAMGPAVDVVVIGAGVIGAAVAHGLARRGAGVVVVDLAGRPVAPSASWASAGGVRRQNRDPREWALSLAASRRWPGLDAELGAPTGFREGGHLHVVADPSLLPAVRARVEAQSAAGLAVELVAPERVRALAPAVGAGVVAGAHTAGDGQADPRATASAFLGAAVRSGASAVVGAASIRVAGGRVAGVDVNDEAISAGAVVLAAGSWSTALAAAAGLRLPAGVRGLQMLRTEPAGAGVPALLPTVSVEGRTLSAKQLDDGSFLLGGGWPAAVDAERHACSVLDDSVAGNWETACAALPALRGLRVADRWCGLESWSPDGAPLLGAVERPAGLWVAAGFCGHGFQLSPAIGDALAGAIRGEARQELAELLPGRFGL